VTAFEHLSEQPCRRPGIALYTLLREEACDEPKVLSLLADWRQHGIRPDRYRCTQLLRNATDADHARWVTDRMLRAGSDEKTVRKPNDTLGSTSQKLSIKRQRAGANPSEMNTRNRCGWEEPTTPRTYPVRTTGQQGRKGT
jgi:hypothetical protein